MPRASDRPASPDISEASSDESLRAPEPPFELPRTQTGVRRREPSLNEASTPPKDGPAPESLRRPYAVLESRRSLDSIPPQSTVQPRSTSRPSTDTRRGPDSAGRRGVCVKHGIARAPSGACLLCEKEAPKKSSRLPLLVGVVVLVLACGTAALFAL